MQVFYLRHLEKKAAFPHLSTACQLNCSWQERQQQTQVFQTPGNDPALKAALGTAQMALESLTRLASLQTQMQQREPRLWYVETVSTTFIFACFLNNYCCAIPKRSKSCICRKDLTTIAAEPWTVCSTDGSSPRIMPDQQDLHLRVATANSWPQECSTDPHQHWP